MQYNCSAIVLKTTKLGESDKILHLYSPEYGLIQAIAKGSRKSQSSFGIKAQVLSYSEFLIAKGRNLDIITQSKLIEDFKNIRQDYDALTMACFFTDVLNSIAIEDEDYEVYFDLLLENLTKLNNPEQELKNKISIGINFLWQLIDQLGYKPELNICSLTNIKRSEQQIPRYFDYANGGIASKQGYLEYEDINPHQSDIRSMNPETFKLLAKLDNYGSLELEEKASASDFISNQSLDNKLQSTIKLLEKHLEYRIHKEFKSWKLLEPVLT